jgi:hypothetical protein
MKRIDLVKHFGAGILIAAAADVPFNLECSLPAAAAGGLGKEMVDKYVRKTEFGWDDMICTTLGGLFYVWVRTMIS